MGERIEYKVVNNEEIYDIIGVIGKKAFIGIKATVVLIDKPGRSLNYGPAKEGGRDG